LTLELKRLLICLREGAVKMRITIPHLGNADFAAKSLFDDLGIEYIVPKVSNKEALELGTKYAPEDICLPYKIMLGNIIMGFKAGADTALITGSCGPCRYGEYCELFKNTFKKLGYDVKLIVADYPKDIGVKELMQRMGNISSASDRNIEQKLYAVYNALKVIKLIDYIETRARYLAGYEVKKGEFKKLIYDCKNSAYNCENGIQMIKVLNEYKRKLGHIKVDMNRNPISIAIIGEIYTILEPFANLYIEDKLIDFGVSVKKSINPSWWVKDAVLAPFKANSMHIRLASREYLSHYVGGHGRECIGEALIAQQQGLDGAIQIFPLGCMPEIVAKSILPNISKDKDFPIMSLVVDEMTGEAGFSTRIEAFVDLLERRKEQNVLYRS
jgi:predicted nucleotide-binding protein (sugar kinase/HSP70/actin superfamily)